MHIIDFSCCAMQRARAIKLGRSIVFLCTHTQQFSPPQNGQARGQAPSLSSPAAGSEGGMHGWGLRRERTAPLTRVITLSRNMSRVETEKQRACTYSQAFHVALQRGVVYQVPCNLCRLQSAFVRTCSRDTVQPSFSSINSSC